LIFGTAKRSQHFIGFPLFSSNSLQVVQQLPLGAGAEKSGASPQIQEYF